MNFINELDMETVFPMIIFISLFFWLFVGTTNSNIKNEIKESKEEIAKIKKEITEICWPQWSKSENYISDINSLNKEK